MALRRLFRWLYTSVAAKRHAIELARAAFAESHDEDDHLAMAKVIATTETATIVRLCYGFSKPPGRAFYSVDEAGAVQQLTFDEVQQYGEPPWL